MAGPISKWVSGVTNSSIGALTLGTVNPGRDKVFGSGVFGGGAGAKAYGQNVLESHAFGMAKSETDTEEATERARLAKEAEGASSDAAQARAAKSEMLRPRTAQEEQEAIRRARESAQRLGAGKRRVSESLTDSAALGGY